MATTTKKPTEDVIRSQAESMYNPEYQATLDALASSAATLETQKNRNVADIQNVLTKTLDETQLNIENSLLKRGMGRSTRAAYEVTSGLADVNESANKTLAQLLEDYSTSINTIETQKKTLASSYQQQIAAGILELNQYYDQLQLAYDQLNAASGGGGGGSSSSGFAFPTVAETNNMSITEAYTTASKSLGRATGGGTPGTAKSTNGYSANFTGSKNGKLYVNGKLYTGTYRGKGYKNGVLIPTTTKVKTSDKAVG